MIARSYDRPRHELRLAGRDRSQTGLRGKPQ
jgi:hypothetical protein